MNKKVHPTSNQIYAELSPHYRHYSEEKSRYLSAIDSLVLGNLPQTAGRVLDVGCGDGVRGNRLRSRVNITELWMIDDSLSMCRLARRFSAPDIKILQLDIANKEQRALPIEFFDNVLCLWNVLGHITEYSKRFQALLSIKNTLKSGGRLFVDVSNRYNAVYYGWKIVLRNIWNDTVRSNPENGTVCYEIKVGDKKIDSYCHFFNPYELPEMCKELNLKILDTVYVDYNTGNTTNRWGGHIFYVIEKP